MIIALLAATSIGDGIAIAAMWLFLAVLVAGWPSRPKK